MQQEQASKASFIHGSVVRLCKLQSELEAVEQLTEFNEGVIYKGNISPDLVALRVLSEIKTRLADGN